MTSPSFRPEEYLAVIADESGRFVAHARITDSTTSVPSCPGWDLDQLTTHVGLLHRWVTVLVGEGRTEPFDRHQLPSPPPGDERFDWFARGSERLVETLAETGTDREVWTLPGLGRSGFWFRRMAHETMVHRVDAEQAGGTSTAVAPALAADGIDEFWTAQLGRRLPLRPVPDLHGTLRLVATDVTAAWTVALAPDSVSIVGDGDPAETVIEGPAEDLLWFVWNRRAATACTVTGDRRLFDDWPQLVKM